MHSSSPIRYHVLHETRYEYAHPVSLSRQLLHLTPRECAWQTVVGHDIVAEPAPSAMHTRLDYFGNTVRQFTLETPHQELLVRAESLVDIVPRAAARLLDDSPAWEDVAAALAYGAEPVLLEATACLWESPYTRIKHQLADYARTCFKPGTPVLVGAKALTQRIFTEFKYDPKATTVGTPLLEAFEAKRGVCQDFAHVMISCLRSIGLSARYVSGYLLTQPPPGKPRMIGADASHAWVAVYCPRDDGDGLWVDFDPTNNVLPDTQHITIAWGRDFGDVTPLRGVILGGDTQPPEVAVTVTPVEETAPVCCESA